MANSIKSHYFVTLTKNSEKDFLDLRVEFMSDLKSKKSSPTQPHMDYPKMQKKNGGIFGGFFSLGGFLGDFSFFFQF
jgi:hypothetical protein